MSKVKLLVLTCLVLLIGAGSVWGWSYFRGDPQMAKVKEMGSQLFSEASRDLPREERHKQWDSFRKEVDALTDEQRDALRREQMGRFSERMEEHLDEFLALSAEERTAQLDEQIDQMEERRQEWEQRRAEGDRDGRRGEGRRGGWDRGGRSNDPNARNERQLRRLDATTPELRAKMTEYRRLMNDRRRERGLPESHWGGPPGGFHGHGGHRGGPRPDGGGRDTPRV